MFNYTFTNKETGEVLKGNLSVAGEGSDVFTLENGEEVTVANVEMDGSNLTNDKYIVALIQHDISEDVPLKIIDENKGGEVDSTDVLKA